MFFTFSAYNIIGNAYNFINREREIFFLVPAMFILIYRTYLAYTLRVKYDEGIHFMEIIYRFNNIDVRLTNSKKVQNLKYSYNKSFVFFLCFLLAYSWFPFFEWLVNS